jgi:hypothetical protein
MFVMVDVGGWKLFPKVGELGDMLDGETILQIDLGGP